MTDIEKHMVVEKELINKSTKEFLEEKRVSFVNFLRKYATNENEIKRREKEDIYSLAIKTREILVPRRDNLEEVAISIFEEIGYVNIEDKVLKKCIKYLQCFIAVLS